MSLTLGTRFGPYEILSALGAGGMGDVYKARDTRLDRMVAIKVLPAQLAADPQFRDRFDREARAISARRGSVVSAASPAISGLSFCQVALQCCSRSHQ
jgi:serine/threonine protein kinase